MSQRLEEAVWATTMDFGMEYGTCSPLHFLLQSCRVGRSSCYPGQKSRVETEGSCRLQVPSELDKCHSDSAHLKGRQGTTYRATSQIYKQYKDSSDSSADQKGYLRRCLHRAETLLHRLLISVYQHVCFHQLSYEIWQTRSRLVKVLLVHWVSLGPFPS